MCFARGVLGKTCFSVLCMYVEHVAPSQKEGAGNKAFISTLPPRCSLMGAKKLPPEVEFGLQLEFDDVDLIRKIPPCPEWRLARHHLAFTIRADAAHGKGILALDIRDAWGADP